MINSNIAYPEFSKNKEKNILRCPVYDCFKPFANVSQLKNHIQRSHKELQDAEIEIAPNGKIKWPPAILDNVLRYLNFLI